MEILVPPRPDHSPPGQLSDAELARAIASLERKVRSVRASLRTARATGLASLAAAGSLGAAVLWAAPDTFLARLFASGTVVTIPELLGWWAAVIAAAFVVGTGGYRFFAHRLRVVRAWRNKSLELERRLAQASAESARRRTA